MAEIIYIPDEDRLNSYNFRDFQKTQMRDSINDVCDAIKEIQNDPWLDLDVDHLYEALADWFPRSMVGDDAEKIIRVDLDNEYVTTVDIRLWENGKGQIEAKLVPQSYSFDEFTEQELTDMGIERR